MSSVHVSIQICWTLTLNSEAMKQLEQFLVTKNRSLTAADQTSLPISNTSSKQNEHLQATMLGTKTQNLWSARHWSKQSVVGQPNLGLQNSIHSTFGAQCWISEHLEQFQDEESRASCMSAGLGPLGSNLGRPGDYELWWELQALLWLDSDSAPLLLPGDLSAAA